MALTFLALLNLRPDGVYDVLERPPMGITPIRDITRVHYGGEYALARFSTRPCAGLIAVHTETW